MLKIVFIFSSSENVADDYIVDNLVGEKGELRYR